MVAAGQALPFRQEQLAQDGMDCTDVPGERLGLRPFPTPLAVNSVAGPDGSAACADLGPCSGRSCPIGAKSDVFGRVLIPLLRSRRIVLMSMDVPLLFRPLPDRRTCPGRAFLTRPN